MTAGFSERLRQADRLETPFIDAFNEHCKTHRIVKFGIESTQMRNIHEYIRSSTDSTSHFLRYLPDSALIPIRQTKTGTPTLIEFKSGRIFIRKDSFLRVIQQCHNRLNNGNPPLTSKQDVFNIERDSLQLQQRLTSIDVNVVVICWQEGRTVDHDRIRAQYANSVVTCQVHNPGRGKSGSGTVIANVHFGDFVPISEFFWNEFGIDRTVTKNVSTAIEG